MERLTATLKQQVEAAQLHIAPGAYNGLSARLVEQAGFPMIYASGGAIARAAGYPDLGLLSFSEVTQTLTTMVDVTSIPIIADADTGFGGLANVARTVRSYERIGIAGMHLEDQVFPKRCGHLNNKTLISCDDMVAKVKIACQSKRDSDFVIIARTDAIAVEGFDAAIVRAQAYQAAGADMIFVEAPESEAQIEAIASAIDAPLMINMFAGGKTPMVSTDLLREWGYRIVIIPSDLQRASLFAMQQTLQAIGRDGDSSSVQDTLASFKARESVIDTRAYLSLGEE